MRRLKPKSAPVGVIGKVLRILELLDDAPYGFQLREIAAKTGINKSTAHRFLCHLESESYIFRDTTGSYMLGPRLARLGAGINLQTTLCRICRPTLEKLRSATDETVNLAVLEGAQILYLDVLESKQTFRLVSPIGMRRPAHCTSLGKAILANLTDERQKETVLASLSIPPAQRTTVLPRLRRDLAAICRQGFSLDDQESVQGARCIGAAVFGPEGNVVGGISVSGPVVRMTRERLPFFSGELCKAAKAISWRLGYRVPRNQRAGSPTAAADRKESEPARRAGA